MEIQSLSWDTQAGIKKLEFRYPDLFKWNGGAWTRVNLSDLDADGNYEMTDISGEKAVINFGSTDDMNEMPDRDDEMLVHVKPQDELGAQEMVSSVGIPVMRFDNGNWQPIKINFPLCLKLASAVYTDVSAEFGSPNLEDNVQILNANSDEILIIAPEIFYGLIVRLTSTFSAGDLSFYYSTGANTWSSEFTPDTEGTSDFTDEEGRIIWGELDGWEVNDIIIDANTHYRGFMIKIKRDSATGNCYMGEMKRLVRLIGESGDILTMEVNQDEIPVVDAFDEIIIAYDDVEESWGWAMWYQQASLNTILEKMLDSSYYTTAKRSVTVMKKSTASSVFNIWGHSPEVNHKLHSTAVYYHSSSGYLYMGLGGSYWCELWRTKLDGEWEFLSRIENEWMSKGSEFEIADIYVTVDVWFVVRERHGVYHDGVKFNYFLYYFDLTGMTLNLSSTPSTFRESYSGQLSIRNGERYEGDSGNWWSSIGQLGTSTPQFGNHGENVCIPFRQLLNPGVANNANQLQKADNLDSDCDLTHYLFRFYFAVWFTADRTGLRYWTPMGYYAISDVAFDVTEGAVGDLEFGFDYGQRGSYLFNQTELNGYTFQEFTDAGSLTAHRFYGLGSTNQAKYEKMMLYGSQNIPICSALHDNENDIFFGHTRWVDVGDDIRSYSYITKFKATGVIDASAVMHDSTTGGFTEQTDNWNNDPTSMPNMNEVGDIIYIGLEFKRFRSVYVEMNGVHGTYAYEYWNGSSWVTLEDIPANNIPDDIVCWSIPNDWAQTTVNGSDPQYYIRIRQTGAANQGWSDAYILEYCLWDSEEDTGNEAMMPVNMAFNPYDSNLYGCMFNRLTTGTYPFQWSFFACDMGATPGFSETVYHSRTGTNFTFNASFLMKDFQYNADDNTVYFVMENRRYDDRSSFVAKASGSASSPTMTKVGTPRENEWGQHFLHITSTGVMYGATKENNVFWEYNDEFYPRVDIAKFDENSNYKNILESVVLIMNYYMFIHSDRTIDLFVRDTVNGTIALDWSTNLINTPPEFEYWEHKYDGIVVDWKDPISGLSGSKKRGFTNWLKKVLNISDTLIQSSHLADLIAADNYTYFNQYRIKASRIRTLFLTQLELIDKFTIFIPANIMDIDNTKEFLIDQIRINRSQKQLELSGVEII